MSITSSITPGQVTELGTQIQRRLSFAIAVLCKDHATTLIQRPDILDKWVLAWTRLRIHGVRIHLDIKDEATRMRLFEICPTFPDVRISLDENDATIMVVDFKAKITDHFRTQALVVLVDDTASIKDVGPLTIAVISMKGCEREIADFFLRLREIMPSNPYTD